MAEYFSNISLPKILLTDSFEINAFNNTGGIMENDCKPAVRKTKETMNTTMTLLLRRKTMTSLAKIKLIGRD